MSRYIIPQIIVTATSSPHGDFNAAVLKSLEPTQEVTSIERTTSNFRIVANQLNGAVEIEPNLFAMRFHSFLKDDVFGRNTIVTVLPFILSGKLHCGVYSNRPHSGNGRVVKLDEEKLNEYLKTEDEKAKTELLLSMLLDGLSRFKYLF